MTIDPVSQPGGEALDQGRTHVDAQTTLRSRASLAALAEPARRHKRTDASSSPVESNDTESLLVGIPMKLTPDVELDVDDGEISVPPPMQVTIRMYVDFPALSSSGPTASVPGVPPNAAPDHASSASGSSIDSAMASPSPRGVALFPGPKTAGGGSNTAGARRQWTVPASSRELSLLSAGDKTLRFTPRTSLSDAASHAADIRSERSQQEATFVNRGVSPFMTADMNSQSDYSVGTARRAAAHSALGDTGSHGADARAEHSRQRATPVVRSASPFATTGAKPQVDRAIGTAHRATARIASTDNVNRGTHTHAEHGRQKAASVERGVSPFETTGAKPQADKAIGAAHRATARIASTDNVNRGTHTHTEHGRQKAASVERGVSPFETTGAKPQADEAIGTAHRATARIASTDNVNRGTHTHAEHGRQKAASVERGVSPFETRYTKPDPDVAVETPHRATTRTVPMDTVNRGADAPPRRGQQEPYSVKRGVSPFVVRDTKPQPADVFDVTRRATTRSSLANAAGGYDSAPAELSHQTARPHSPSSIPPASTEEVTMPRHTEPGVPDRASPDAKDQNQPTNAPHSVVAIAHDMHLARHAETGKNETNSPRPQWRRSSETSTSTGSQAATERLGSHSPAKDSFEMTYKFSSWGPGASVALKLERVQPGTDMVATASDPRVHRILNEALHGSNADLHGRPSLRLASEEVESSTEHGHRRKRQRG